MRSAKIIYVLLFIQLLYWMSITRVSFPHVLPSEFHPPTLDELQEKLYFILPAVFTSLKIFFGVYILNLVFAIFVASILIKNRVPEWFNLFFYAPILAPAYIPILGSYDFLLRSDLLGSPFAVILIQACFFFPFLYRPIEVSLRSRDFKEERVALDLGSSKIEVLFKVTLPLLRSALLLGGFLTLIASFNDYLITFLIGDTFVETLPVKLLPLMQSGERNNVAFYTLIYLVPIGLLCLSYKEDSHARN